MNNPEYVGYHGTLDRSKMTDRDTKSAYTAWANQNKRCNNKNNPRYKDNGAKGIRVLYTSRELIAWYLHHIKTFKGKNPSIGRIDHSGHYCLENIRIESLEENSMERITRVGTTRPRKTVIIYDYDSNSPLMIVESLSRAAKLSGVQTTHLPRYCRGELKRSKDGFGFKYA